MRVNTRVFNERQDLFSELFVKGCPIFEKEANNILNLVAKPGFSIGIYHTMNELDKKLMLEYWQEYEDLATMKLDDFKFWFVNCATPPENIRRARQWLSEHNYIIIDSEVQEHAYQAGDKKRASVRR